MYNIEKEKQEALEAGQRALTSLTNAQKELESAKNWGVWDMLGGGLISSLFKQRKMENAQNYMEQAKCDLRNFSRELRDVEMVCDLNIETNDFLSFADWFFDGFFVDAMVQGRINRASQQVDEAIRRVEDIVDQLQKL